MKLRGTLLVLAIGGLALTVAGQAPNTSPAPAPDQTQPQVLTPPATGQTAMQATSGANGNTSAASSQQSSTPEDDTVTTIRKTVNEVNVVFTVTDKHGRYVKDLKRNDFNFVDDAKPAAEIRDFKSQTDLPLQVGLLIDASNSVRDRLSSSRNRRSSS